MYTGFPPAPPPPRRNRFWVAIVSLALVTVVLCCAVFSLVISAADKYGLLDRGTYLKGRPAVSASPSVTPLRTVPPGEKPDLNIVDVPVVTKQPGVESGALTATQVYEKVVPSVVGIVSVDARGRDIGTGTGSIIGQDGYICTNNHVVADAASINVVLHDGKQYEATIVGTDMVSDIAVIKIETTGLIPVELGNSEALKPGDIAYAIGNPLGLDLQNTITNGIISAINRDIIIDDYYGAASMTVLQTNCAINPGNSGGPLLNQYGQMVGIISSKIMGDYFSSVEGLGFAIPVSTAAPVLQELMQNGYIRGRPAIGITADPEIELDRFTAEYLGVPIGVVVGEVNENSDAFKKGIQPGDIVTHVNGTEVTSVAEINQIKNKFKAGDTITLSIYREGRSFDVNVILMDSNEMG